MKGLCQKYNFFILKTYKQAQPREKKLHYLVTFLENNTLLECITFKSIFPQHWSGVHIHAAAFGPETLYWMTSNWTTQHIINASSVSELYDWPRIDVLRQMVLNSYVLIPLLFCIHTEHHVLSCKHHTGKPSYRWFTGNFTTSHTGTLPEWFYRYFGLLIYQ